MTGFRWLAAVSSIALATPLAAQETSPPAAPTPEQTAQSSEPENTGDDIIVTATKRATSIQDAAAAPAPRSASISRARSG